MNKSALAIVRTSPKTVPADYAEAMQSIPPASMSASVRWSAAGQREPLLVTYPAGK